MRSDKICFHHHWNHDEAAVADAQNYRNVLPITIKLSVDVHFTSIQEHIYYAETLDEIYDTKCWNFQFTSIISIFNM